MNTDLRLDVPDDDDMKVVPEKKEGTPTKKVKKKIIKRRNPVIQTPQTAQETVAKTVEAAAATKGDKTVYKANGEQAREANPMEGRVKRGPRVGRGMVEENGTPAEGTSLGVVDDFSLGDKF